jgi:hypothetical protein
MTTVSNPKRNPASAAVSDQKNNLVEWGLVAGVIVVMD